MGSAPLSGVRPAEDTDRQAVRWIARALLYFISGLAVGFLFLAEFAFSTVAIVQIAIAAVTVIGLFGGFRRHPNLSIWSTFVLGAISFPLLIDARTAFLPLCKDLVASGIACVARDYRGQFTVELASFLASCLGTVLYARLGLRQRER